ncbi:MAG TPA: exopolysaccharide biosynthesis polyprenyl glycosylphosphotransferase [Solirubrobacterales bacterium]|nr:exopolysaccharide biosynthesis polyprenyl glycosylphosphotransferase [Solirubrobacterales bacterium]
MSEKTVPAEPAGPAAAPPIGDPERAGLSQVPAGLKRRRSVQNAALLAPPAVAAAASFAFGGLDVEAGIRAVVLGLAIFATGLLLKSFKFPHRLMSVSRVIVAAAPALAGAFIAGLLATADAYDLAATGLVPATLLALLTAITVEVGGGRLLAARPLRVAVLGSPVFAAGLKRELEADSAEAVEVIGWLNLGEAAGGSGGDMQIGTLDSIRSAVTEHGIDLLVRGHGLWESNVSRHAYQTIAEGCVDLPVRMIDGNQFYEQLFGHVPIGTIGSDWYLYLMHPSFEGTSPLTKRCFDVLGASLAALVAAPLIAVAAVGIKLFDRGPVLYRQTRVGEGGREYKIIKLRTMTVDAEASGAQFSSARDNRVTGIGRVLRRTHVDELPQIINVLRGEMTLVGPRPERPEMIAELERLFPHYKRRLLVKPGVTGWAQVRCGYGGSEVGTAWKLCHDLFYLKHRSVLADVLIMIETVAMAARDAHRPMRAPRPEFLFDLDTVEGLTSFRAASATHPDDPAAGHVGVPEISLGSPSSVGL